MSEWCDGGDNEAVDIALDALSFRGEYYEFEPLSDEMTRDERVVVAAKHLVTAAQVVGRLKMELGDAEAKYEELRAVLTAEMSVPPRVPLYAEKVFRRLEAEGIGQPDLHPASKRLAEVLAETVRTYNRDRRVSAPEDVIDEYSDEPVPTWAQLPDTFAGFQLKEIEAKESFDINPCPLPPSTEIAYFTPDGRRPRPLQSRLDTLIAWAKLIRAWGERNNQDIDANQALIWAVLLGHRLKGDHSDSTRFKGRELVSPWNTGKLARIHVLPPRGDSEGGS
jgi:hypothetical protein